MNVRIFWVRATKCMYAQTRPRFILSSEGVFGGNGVWTHVNSKGKIPSTEKCPQRRIEPVTLWTASPSTTNWAIPAPGYKWWLQYVLRLLWWEVCTKRRENSSDIRRSLNCRFEEVRCVGDLLVTCQHRHNVHWDRGCQSRITCGHFAYCIIPFVACSQVYYPSLST